MSSSSSPGAAARPRPGLRHPVDEAVHAAFEGLGDAVHVYDEQWRWVYMNPAAARWVRTMGRDPRKLTGKRVWDVFPLEADVREAAERAVREGRETVTEIAVPGLGGAWYETRIVPVRGGIVSFSRDVTERHHAEERQRVLSEASAVLSTSLEPESTLNALAGLAAERIADYAVTWVLDEPRRVLRAVGASGGGDDDVLQRFLRRAIPLDSGHGVAEAVRSGEPCLAPSVSDEALRRAAHDEEHLAFLRHLAPTSSAVVPLRARGRTLGAFATVTVRGGRRPHGDDDLVLMMELASRAALAYDNARLLEQSQAASRAKSQFLATISHELRTPLTAILGYADLLDAGLSGPLTDPQRSQIRRIMMSSRHLVSVIDQILTFSRAEAGHEEVRLETVMLDEILEQTAALLEPQALEKDLALKRRGGGGGQSMRTDAGKLRQILLNLGGNALKFTEEGSVELELEEADEGIVFRVRDTGPGIASGELERIFEPFTQVHGSDTRPYGGAGLGLAVCRRLARLLGGDVTVESAPGAGSTFTLRLPS